MLVTKAAGAPRRTAARPVRLVDLRASALNWTPEVALATSVAKTVDYFRGRA